MKLDDTSALMFVCKHNASVMKFKKKTGEKYVLKNPKEIYTQIMFEHDSMLFDTYISLGLC